MKKNPFKINTYQTHVHIYGGQLIFGDAYEIIKVFKKDHDVKNVHPFESNKIQIKNLKQNKIHSFVSSDHDGGCWTPIYTCKKKSNYVDSIFIDTAAAHLFPYYKCPDVCKSKNHLKIINEMIEKVLLENKEKIGTKKDVARKLNFKSQSILFTQSGGIVNFHTKDDKFRMDYTKTVEEIYKQLDKLYWNPDVKFLNYELQEEEITFDFYVDGLSYGGYGGNSHLMYPVKSLVEDVDWFANYYAKFYGDERDLYAKQKPKKEDIKAVKKFQDKYSFLGVGLNNSFTEDEDEIEQSMQKPLIESYKSYVEEHGFIHGYYIVPSISKSELNDWTNLYE